MDHVEGYFTVQSDPGASVAHPPQQSGSIRIASASSTQERRATAAAQTAHPPAHQSAPTGNKSINQSINQSIIRIAANQ